MFALVSPSSTLSREEFCHADYVYHYYNKSCTINTISTQPMNQNRMLVCYGLFLKLYDNYLSSLLLCLGSLSESILESPGHSLHITHTSSSNSTATFCFLTPVKGPHLWVGVSTGSTSLLLAMERSLSATTASRVRLRVPFSERCGSLSLLVEKKKG